MIDLLAIESSEAERLAYAEGFTMAAELLARIDALQRSLCKAIAENEQLKTDLYVIRRELAHGGYEQ